MRREAPIRESNAAQAVADRLLAATGMDAGSLEDSRLRSIIDARCRRLKLADASAYMATLEADPAELEELIDATVIRETRFFRDPTVFDHIRQAAVHLAAEFHGTLRVLSAPCSTGQESYSLGATLVQAGIPLSRFAIDAFDLSQVALATARAGVYPQETTRPSAGWRVNMDTVGTLADGQWTVHEALRQRVHFDRRNLAEPGVLGQVPEYHLILCRNLFIYLAPDARAALARSLAGALIPGGRLVIGTADRVEELSAVFSPLKPAASFSFVHRELSVAARTDRPAAAPAPRKPAAIPMAMPVRAVPSQAPAAAPSALNTPDGLYRRALDDQKHNDLRKAERRCRQALYLDPRFLPALELLEALWREHPNLRLRHALSARIHRRRNEVPANEIPIPLDAGQEDAL